MLAVSQCLFQQIPVLIEAMSHGIPTVIALLRGIFAMDETLSAVLTSSSLPFNSKEFSTFSKQLVFIHMMSSHLYTLSNGYIEYYMRTLKTC